MALPDTQNRFTVIDGGAQPPSPFQDFPNSLIARSPFNKEQAAYYRFSKLSLAKMDAAKRRQPILDAWTCVFGRVPPVNNSSILEKHGASKNLVSLTDALACFRGVKRPVGDDKYGFDTFAFVTRPRWAARYQPSMSCLITWFPVPEDLLFVTYVRLDQPAVGRYGSQAARGLAVRGVVSHWQFVESEPGECDMPVGYQERYRRRLW